MPADPKRGEDRINIGASLDADNFLHLGSGVLALLRHRRLGVTNRRDAALIGLGSVEGIGHSPGTRKELASLGPERADPACCRGTCGCLSHRGKTRGSRTL